MRRFVLPLLAAVVVLSSPAGAEPVVRFVDFEQAVTGATGKRILRAIEDADREGNDLVLVRLDTPGGLVPATEDIVKGMLASRTPVAVWVGPSGAHAASAGFVILMAADVAAMAPGTRCGAASVVFNGESKEEDIRLKKATEDLAALVRSIAEKRGRDVEAAEKAIFEADAYTETEALDQGLINLVAASREDLLSALDGQEIERFDGTKVLLQTGGARFVSSKINFRDRVFEFLADPVVMPLLLLLGILGFWVEMSHPGLIFPAVFGALCLILFFFAAQTLPVSTIGVLLILLALVMFVLEIKVTSYGMLTLGGATALIIGFMMLVEGPIPELRVPVSVYLPTALLLTALCTVALRLAIRAQRERVATGVEGLTGKVGTVTVDLRPSGKVFVHGELWDAVSKNRPVEKGTRVRIVRAEEMQLVVEAIPTPRPEEE